MYDLSPYLNNTLVDHRLIGGEMTLCPFLANNSAPRSDMLAGNLPQAQILSGGEHPRIFTGYESIFADYTFDTTKRDQDIEVIDVVAKYRSVSGMHQISENPTMIVIYLGLTDRKLGYFEISSYTKGSDGYGHFNVLQNHHLLKAGTFIGKDEVLSSSPIKDGNKYGLGTNVNVAYMTELGTIEDAFVISRSMSNKMSSRGMNTVTIKLAPNQHPLNLYGDDTSVKFLPDIGETVREDGVLCGFRTPTGSTFMSDTLDQELYQIHPNHDKVYYAPAGATIVDVDYHVNKADIPEHLYAQVNKYKSATIARHQRIVEIYQEYKDKYELTPNFNTLVTKSAECLVASGKRIRGMAYKANARLVDKDTAIDYMQIDVTYTYERTVERGFKLSGRDGGSL